MIRLINEIRSSRLVNDELQEQLDRIELLLISGTAITPKYLGNQMPLAINEMVDESNNLVSSYMELNNMGVPVRSKLDWITRMIDALSQFYRIIPEIQTAIKEYNLYEIYNRSLLVFGLIESIKTNKDYWHVIGSIVFKTEEIVDFYLNYGIIPSSIVLHCLYDNGLRNAVVKIEKNEYHQSDIKIAIDGAYKFSDIADKIAEKARASKELNKLITLSHEALLYYNTSTDVFTRVLYSKVLSDSEKSDLVRDFGVIEEFRVGCYEAISSFGMSLISRFRFFLFGNENRGLKLPKALDRTILAIKSQINIYPDILIDLWASFISKHHYNDIIPMTDMEVLLFEEKLQGNMIQYIQNNDFFKDLKFIKQAVRLHENYYKTQTFNYTNNWSEDIFNIKNTTLNNDEINFNEGAYYIHNITAEKLLSRLLSRDWHELLDKSYPDKPIKLYKSATGFTHGGELELDL